MKHTVKSVVLQPQALRMKLFGLSKLPKTLHNFRVSVTASSLLEFRNMITPKS